MVSGKTWKRFRLENTGRRDEKKFPLYRETLLIPRCFFSVSFNELYRRPVKQDLHGWPLRSLSTARLTGSDKTTVPNVHRLIFRWRSKILRPSGYSIFPSSSISFSVLANRISTSTGRQVLSLMEMYSLPLKTSRCMTWRAYWYYINCTIRPQKNCNKELTIFPLVDTANK